jgi:hypothetical protein
MSRLSLNHQDLSLGVMMGVGSNRAFEQMWLQKTAEPSDGTKL